MKFDLLKSLDENLPIKQGKRPEPKKSWITNRTKSHIATRTNLMDYVTNQLWIKTKSQKKLGNTNSTNCSNHGKNC